MKKTIIGVAFLMAFMLSSLLSKAAPAPDTRDAAIAAIKNKIAANPWITNVAGGLIGDQGFPHATTNGYGEHGWSWGTTKANGFLFYMPNTNTVWLVNGAIRDEFGRLNNEHDKRMGFPTCDAFPIRDGGLCQRFQGEQGSSGTNIYWTPKYGAHAVIQTLFSCYTRVGWENGVLGYPMDNERECCCGDHGPGTYQTFEHGIIYHKKGASNSYMVLNGPMMDFYKSKGYEGGEMGFPTSDTKNLGTGFSQEFTHVINNSYQVQNPSIYFIKNGSKNAYYIDVSNIRNQKFLKQYYDYCGGPNGQRWGYPINNMFGGNYTDGSFTLVLVCEHNRFGIHYSGDSDNDGYITEDTKF